MRKEDDATIEYLVLSMISLQKTYIYIIDHFSIINILVYIFILYTYIYIILYPLFTH